MGAPSMVDRLLAAADDLLRIGRHSAAYRRRAVSTAYYAVFHALAKTCAECLVPDSRRNCDDYQRIYRALDHGPLRSVFTQQTVKSHQALEKLGPIVIRLQSERHRADYLAPQSALFPPAEVSELIEQARLVVQELEKLDLAGRRLLATCLLFKERKP